MPGLIVVEGFIRQSSDDSFIRAKILHFLLFSVTMKQKVPLMRTKREEAIDNAAINP